MHDLRSNLDLLRLLVVREIRVRYARTLLGVAWAVFQPLAYMLVFVAMRFGSFIREGSVWEHVPYSAFAFCGLTFWLNFQQSLLTGTNSLVLSRGLLHKCKFMTETLPASRVFAWLLDLVIGCGLLALIMYGHGMPFHATALLVPVIYLLQLAMTLGIVFFLSAVNLFFRDVYYLLGVFVMLLMFASNVVYPIDHVEGLQGEILALNPVSSLLEAYRTVLFLGRAPTLLELRPALIGAAVAVATGVTYFRRVSPRFAEEV